VLENVWKFRFLIAEARLPFAENAEEFSKKMFYGNIFKKKNSKIIAEEFLKSFRKKFFCGDCGRCERDFQAL
jgi:hypothetical protein